MVQKEGCGNTFVCGDLTSIQLNLLKQLRQNMPNKIISYTFPVDGNNIDFPYRDIECTMGPRILEYNYCLQS